jgi:hypothetical protein
MFLTLLPYLTVAANLALVLLILLGLNQRMRRLADQSAKQAKAHESDQARWNAEISDLQTRIGELEQAGNSIASNAPPAASTTSNGVNSTLRSKVLKLHRMGQSPDRIAGSLRVPKGEVDLLVKVHKIVMRPYEEVVLAPLGVEGQETPEKKP